MRKGDGFKKKGEREEKEFEQSLVDIARVTRVKAGGKRLSFRALVVLGDKKGRIGAGIGKGKDVSTAVDKAVARAKKNLFQIQIVNGTIAHEVLEKFKASKVLLKPAKQGRGVIAGGSVRTVLELAGVGNVVAKMRGSHSKINNVFATINGLRKLRRVEVKESGVGDKAETKRNDKETEREATSNKGTSNKKVKAGKGS